MEAAALGFAKLSANLPASMTLTAHCAVLLS
jgi:hypothetical protein